MQQTCKMKKPDERLNKCLLDFFLKKITHSSLVLLIFFCCVFSFLDDLMVRLGTKVSAEAS